MMQCELCGGPGRLRLVTRAPGGAKLCHPMRVGGLGYLRGRRGRRCRARPAPSRTCRPQRRSAQDDDWIRSPATDGPMIATFGTATDGKSRPGSPANAGIDRRNMRQIGTRHIGFPANAGIDPPGTPLLPAPRQGSPAHAGISGSRGLPSGVYLLY